MPNTSRSSFTGEFVTWSGGHNSPFGTSRIRREVTKQQEKTKKQKEDFSKSVFNYYSCPVHHLKGYLIVSREILKELRILSKISEDSKVNPLSGAIYLDTREDSPLFFQAYKEKYKKKPVVAEKSVDIYLMLSIDDYKSVN